MEERGGGGNGRAEHFRKLRGGATGHLGHTELLELSLELIQLAEELIPVLLAELVGLDLDCTPTASFISATSFISGPSSALPIHTPTQATVSHQRWHPLSPDKPRTMNSIKQSCRLSNPQPSTPAV